MTAEDDDPPCEQCGGQTSFVLQIHPSGTEAGARIYYCSTCQHHTWQDLHSPQSRWPSGPAVPEQPAQQPQQQQQQTQPKNGESEE
jgi:hypothetical protein